MHVRGAALTTPSPLPLAVSSNELIVHAGTKRILHHLSTALDIVHYLLVLHC